LREEDEMLELYFVRVKDGKIDTCDVLAKKGSGFRGAPRQPPTPLAVTTPYIR
jgi:hypothetical protein